MATSTATQTLTRGQKAAATRKANQEKTAAANAEATEALEATETDEDETAPVSRNPRIIRSTTAPVVDPMFSDIEDEAIDPEGKPAVKEDAPVQKERRMHIQAEFVPGKAALATLTPDALAAIAFISTYNTVDEQSSSPRQHGYQRDPMDARFPAIGRYFSQEDGDGTDAKHTHAHLITPIIASVRVYNPKDQARFNYLFNKGEIDTIHQEFGKSVVSIVDGQHRTGGLFWAWERKANFNPDVPVMLYYGLRYADEATLFDTVNTTQRRLPKALIESTKVHMEAGEPTHAQLIREVAFALAQDGDSPWSGQINMTGARDPEHPISYEGLRRSTGNMLHEKLVSRLKGRGLVLDKVAKKYWELVSRTCAPAWQGRPKLVKGDDGELVEEKVQYRLKDLAGVASVSRLGADIIGTALDQSRTEEEFYSAMASMVSKLGAVDWAKEKGNPWTSYGAGFAGMTGLYATLYSLTYLDQMPGEEIRGGEVEAPASE